jgi:hypothetical protein
MGNNVRASSSADAQLLEVWVPGSVRTMNDPPNKTLDPMLDPRMQPPAFAESPEIARNCSPSSLGDVSDEAGIAMIDPMEFHRIMTYGLEVAQARHVWSFNVERNKAQLGKVSGPRTAAIRNSNNSATRPEPRTVQRRQPIDFAGMLGLKIEPTQKPRTGSLSREEIQSKLPNFVKMEDDLQYNRSVLEAQDVVLKQKEATYGDMLVGLYQASVDKFVTIPSENRTFETLNRFDAGRESNLQSCMARTNLTSDAHSIFTAANAKYLPVARTIVANTRSRTIATLRRTKSSMEFSKTFASLYSTELLKYLAQNDAELAKDAGSYNEQLLAKEAREREEVRKKIAAEEARRLAQQKAEFKRRSDQNVPPSIEEVTRLYTTHSIAISDKNYYRLERTSYNSFGVYNILFKMRDVTLSLSNLTCEPRAGKQHCFFHAKPYFEDLLGFQRTDPTISVEADFYWTDSGLASSNLKGTEFYDPYVPMQKEEESLTDRLKKDAQQGLDRVYDRIRERNKY